MKEISKPMTSKPIKDAKVVFCGIVRDCGRHLARNLKRVEDMRSRFSSLRFVLVENDSKDDTKEVLRALQQRDPTAIIDISDFGTVTAPKKIKISSGVNPSYSHHRISKLSDYRNKYLELIENEIGLESIDWVIMLDWDIESFCPESILSTLEKSAQWDVATANGRCKVGFTQDLYFDLFAYRALGQQGACTEASIRGGRQQVDKDLSHQELVYVESAFNALALYRAESLQGLRYRAEPNDDSRVEVWCEHVTLHRELAQRGFNRIVIDRSLHARYNTRASALVEMLRSVGRSIFGPVKSKILRS